MPVFKPMPEDVLLAITQEYDDILTPMVREQDEFYAQFSCPRCRCQLVKEFSIKTAFTSGAILPKATLRCMNCGYIVDPHSNLVLSTGNKAAVVPVEVIPGTSRTT